jgi:hypothetical protein
MVKLELTLTLLDDDEYMLGRVEFLHSTKKHVVNKKKKNVGHAFDPFSTNYRKLVQIFSGKPMHLLKSQRT